MSSCGNPAVETDALMPRRRKFDKTKFCVKCKINSGNIVVRHAVYCKACFFLLVTSKFKKSLEPSVNPTRRTKLRASGNLLIGFSGGLGSTVLLDLVAQCYFSAQPLLTEDGKLQGGKDHPRNARVWKKAHVCYVEVCSAFPGTRDRTDEVRSVVEKYEAFEFLPLRIEDAFDPSWWRKVRGGPDPLELGVDLTNEDLILSTLENASHQVRKPVEALHTSLASLPTQTAVPTTINTLVRLLLLYTALSSSSSHLLLGTSLTSLSITLISSISQGGGFVIREEAEEEWTPPEERNTDASTKGGYKRTVRVSRPLRDVGMKECAAWAWWTGLKVVGREKIPGGRQGIGGLTKEFIVGLERDYPSTVSTIARTCGKLASKEVSDGSCVLCERPAQRNVQEWKNRISIRSFTPPELVSNSETNPVPKMNGSTNPVLSSLTPYLCYACHTTLTSRSSRGVASSINRTLNSVADAATPISLPVWVHSRLSRPSLISTDSRSLNDDRHEEHEEVWQGKKMEAREMKDAVADFLLDDRD